MEKRKPTHSLGAFKNAFAQHRAITITARQSAAELGFEIDGVVKVVQSIEAKDFVKSMTSYEDHRRWQVVYVVQFGALSIYVKLTDRAVTEFIILTFKRK